VSGRAEYATAVIGMLAAGALALLVTQPTWVEVTAAGATDAGVTVVVDVPGSQAAALVVPLSLVVLAGALGVLATRGLARRAVGVLVVLAGAGLAWDCLAVLFAPRSAVAGALTARSLDPQAAAAATYSSSWWWPVIATVAGIVAALAGALTAARARRWPAMGARFDSPGAAARGVDPWAALDRGEDPTQGPAVPDPAQHPRSGTDDGDLPE
jgi:uncharacterized membrane protein (TIGR02234 family)